MNERIKKLAEQAGFVLWPDRGPFGEVIDWASSYDMELEKFAELVRADERQAIEQAECDAEVYSVWVEQKPVHAIDMSQERVDETAKGEHEPVAWLWKNIDGHQVLTDDPDYADGTWTPLYTAPPKKEWVGLTDEEVINCFDSVAFGQVEDDLIINKHVNIFTAIHYIEAKLKEKNT